MDQGGSSNDKKTWGRKSPWTVPLTATEIHLGKNMLGLQHLGTAGADHAVDDGYLFQHGTEFLHVWRVVVLMFEFHNHIRGRARNKTKIISTYYKLQK